MCLWGALCFLAYYSSVLFSWMPGFLLMFHVSSSFSIVTAVTVLATPCSIFSSFSSGPTEPPSHQRFMIFQRRDRKSLSFLSCCNMTSWVTEVESLDCSVFPNLIKQSSACCFTIISSQGPVYTASRIEKERISIIDDELCSEKLCVPCEHQDLVSTLKSWQLATTYLRINSLTKISQASCKQTFSGSPQWSLNTLRWR